MTDGNFSRTRALYAYVKPGVGIRVRCKCCAEQLPHSMAANDGGESSRQSVSFSASASASTRRSAPRDVFFPCMSEIDIMPSKKGLHSINCTIQ